MEDMRKLKDMLCRELDEFSRRDSIESYDLDTIHKLTDTIKNLDKIEMLEDGGYSQARGGGVSLKSFSPLHIKISLEGGNIMDYKIEEKRPMYLTGYKKRFEGDPNDKKDQDHYFACSTRVLQYILEGMSREHETTYEVLTNFDAEGYDFYYAYELPKWALEDFDEDLGEVAKQFEHLPIPGGLYFVCQTEKCMFPTNLVDDLRRRAVTEWLPSSGYVLRDAPEIGVIHWPFEEGNEEVNNSHYCEIWLPVEKK